MNAVESVIAIIDVGKTNKKLLLFNEQYQVVYEQTASFAETIDEDNFPCDNIETLTNSALESIKRVTENLRFDLKAINFATYGASFVYLNNDGKPIAPLYNYLKPFSENLLKQFYTDYGGEENFSQQTASPVLGNLNSGMQVYSLKYQKPDLFNKTKWALHLPQYLAFLFSKKAYTDITSIGCHTNLWDFQNNNYHAWVKLENIEEKFAPIIATTHTDDIEVNGKTVKVGTGLHDSSSALIPYLVSFTEPFVLISTGTWCITLNPFNQLPLSKDELKQDCLCYLQYSGKPVKAARVFAGNEHEIQIKKLAEHFNKPEAFYKTVQFNAALYNDIKLNIDFINSTVSKKNILNDSGFSKRNLGNYKTYEEAYHQLIADIVQQQKYSSNLVIEGTNAKRIFVDGGFAKNTIYMNLLAEAFPTIEVYAASMPQATALGAELALHQSWNTKPLPTDIIELKFFKPFNN